MNILLSLGTREINMPGHTIICKMKPYIQPFEKILAMGELSSIAKTKINYQLHDGFNNIYQIDTKVSSDTLRQRLAYWETVCDGRCEVTIQVQREATVYAYKNGYSIGNADYEDIFDKNIQIPNRRVLRYGPHGIHEYRGKFFPQLVRSLANIANIRCGEVILDPMCGSGTTAVESNLLGCTALGIDMNPLSVLMSRTKCDLITTNPNLIFREYKALVKKINDFQYKPKSLDYEWISKLPNKDKEYLISWFPLDVIADLDWLKCQIDKVDSNGIRNMFLLILSNILRKVSYQKTDDLRIRKEIYDENVDVFFTYLSELERTVKVILPFVHRETKRYDVRSIIIHGDARIASQYFPTYIGKVNGIITSPPYATALPYLDTDRLSLCFLGILPRSKIRKMDWEMIGNREITEKIRGNYWERFKRKGNILPQGIIDVINLINELNKNSNVGFRRKNLPSLLAKYFFDMRGSLIEMKQMLKAGAPAYIVIGNNHTIAGGQKVEIKTDNLLGQLGEAVGLNLEETISMDMLISRDIFKRNAVASETILCFRNP
jgi:DNA modification methylase